ncbi:DUF6612 family protein [Fervidibacillus halotolerans]|uniref:Lipoprotein n=1 Tax=Fervidibacillus halotolerans TaxID=2980027 RepID=A0A9E8RY24_9BACI|nr:DUF6612 family protein [Fervidibacillus halotolerans]WAA11789.1 hypothetical protein OE105_09190 [Fervidibacillus halotolerans]
MIKLKKIAHILFASILLFSLAGCNQIAEKVGTKEETSVKEKEEGESLLDVFQKSMDAVSSLDSYSIYMESEQEVIENSTSEPIHMNMTLEMDVTTNPEAVHQKLSMFVPDFEDAYEMEIYYTDQGYFMYEPFSNTWMKMPEDMFLKADHIPQAKTDPYMQIEQLKKYIDDFSFKVNDSDYIISLNVSGDSFLDFVKEETIDFLKGEGEKEIEELMGSVSLNQLDYKIHIDKETYLLKQIEMVMQLQVDEEGEEISFFQKSVFTYKNFNTIDKIIVPEDIVNSAKENDF